MAEEENSFKFFYLLFLTNQNPASELVRRERSPRLTTSNRQALRFLGIAMKAPDRGLLDVCPNLSSLGGALKSKWTNQFHKGAEDKELRPVLRVGHLERTSVQRTLCLREVECYGYGMEKRAIGKQRSSPKLLWVPMWQEPALGERRDRTQDPDGRSVSVCPTARAE